MELGFLEALLIIFGVLNLAFAGLIYFHSTRSTVVTFYVLISFFASLWSLATLLTGTSFLSFTQLKIAFYAHYVFGYLAYLSFFWFALYYPTRSLRSLFWPLVLTASTLAYLFLIPTSFFATISPGRGLAESVTFALPGYPGFILMLSGVFALGLFVLTQRFAKTSASERFRVFDRYQILFAILANFIAGVLGISLNLILPFFGDFSLFYINPILVTLALTGIGLYNLLKYNLFNIKVVLAELFAVAIWMTLLSRAVLAENDTDRYVGYGVLGFSVIFGLFLIRSVLREVEAREHIEHLAKELKTANERLKELDRQKTEFVSIASHQLRSPLTAIKGYASLLMEGSFGKLGPAAYDAARKVFNSSQYMALSIEDFLNVSRIELGTVKYDRKETDLKKLVSDTVSELAPTAHEKGLLLSFKSSQEGPVMVSVDIGKFKQVITNLIDNALKYTPKGSVAVAVSKDVGRKIARFEVKDNGVGIPQDVIPKLFEKFSRAKNANEVNVMGTGLGLFVAKQFVLAHSGTIWAESEGQGRGSTFIVEVPLSS